MSLGQSAREIGYHSAVAELLDLLPPPGQPWPQEHAEAWLKMAEGVFVLTRGWKAPLIAAALPVQNPGIVAPARAAKGEAVSVAEKCRDEVPGLVATMIAERPDGVSIADLRRALGVSHPYIRTAVRDAVKEKLLVEKRLGPVKEIRLFPPGHDVPPAPLTENQKAVLDVMRRMAKGNEVEVTMRQLCVFAGVSKGSINDHVLALEQKGCIVRMRTGSGTEANVYKLRNPANGGQDG